MTLSVTQLQLEAWQRIMQADPSATLIQQASASPVSFQLSNINLSGWRSGPSDTTPVLCLHGWLDNANSFLPLAAAMSTQSLLAVDFAGHGLSSHRSPDAHYYLFDYVADLVELIQQQSWSKLHIIGHSMGGMVATALAAAMPELVARLVLVDSLGFVTTAPEDTAIQLRKALQSRQGRLQKHKPKYETVQQAAAARQNQSDFTSQEALLLTQRGSCLLNGSSASITWSADLRLRELSAQRLTIAQATALIGQLQCPVMAIMAEDGIELMQQNLALYQSSYPQLQLQHLAGGHHLHMTNASAVAVAISQFFQQAE
ncbi:MAG: alpha/beta hydrolase [Rheinheimera sp.]|nr:alpha/beta hydrolase [Rheinheimera sp.]